MSCFRVSCLLLLAGLIVIVGCGSGTSLAPVEGTLKVGGKAVDKIQVEFVPENRGSRSIGVTDESGRYVLSSQDGKSKGATVGSHRVILRDVGIMGDKFLGRKGEDVDMTKGKKPRIGAIFSSAETTPLKKEVKSGPNTIDLEANP